MVHYVDVHVGKQLRKCREMKAVTQNELASAGGVTFQQIQKYEHGFNRISCSKLHIFAKKLGVDVSYFFEGVDGDVVANSSDVVPIAPSKKEKQLLALYRQLPNSVQSTVLEIVSLMADAEN